MATRSRGPVAVSDLASAILDPVLRRRAGISVGLVQNWDEIVGERMAAMSRPEKIAWPRRLSDDDPFQPATLVVACSGIAAMHVQHETSQIIERVNAFLGFAAVGRVRIVQKPVAAAPQRKRALRALSPNEVARVEEMTAGIEDDELRQSLARLGRSVKAARKP
ncbi:MAG TPA: DciA family protein [Rhizobiaceae bacterium]|nr:DciA family protein [Rhizobiaceae bacterium]